MASEKIKVEIDLEAARSQRRVLSLKEKVKGVGDEAQEAGKKGSEGFDQFGKSALGVVGQVAGISFGLAGVVTLMRQVYENQLAINLATAENIRQQQQRIGAAAVTLGSPLNRNLAQMLGVSEAAAFQRSGTLAAALDLPHRDVSQMLLDIAPRIGVGAAPDVGIFARGTGTGAAASGQLFSILTEQFGLRGGARRGAAARVGGVAQQSALTPENLLRILTPTSALLKQAGVETPVEQAALSAAFAQFEPPGEPDLTKTAIKQLTRLVTQQVDPFTKRLIAQSGRGDPDNPTLPDLIGAYQKFLQGGRTADERRARVRELATKTNIPPRVLEKVAFTAVDSFTDVFERTLAAGRGATFADVQARAAERIASPEAQQRSADLRTRLRDVTVGAIPGTGPEAVRLLSQFMAVEGLRGPEATEVEAQQFRAQMIHAGFGDERLTEEQTRRLFFLLRVWANRVRPALGAILGASPPGGVIGNRANSLIVRGENAAANAQEHQIIGSQANSLVLLEAVLVEAIEFLRDVQLGATFEAERPVNVGAFARHTETISATPTAAQQAAAGPGITPITPAGVVNNISQQTNIINGADPATATLPNRGTGPAPGE